MIVEKILPRANVTFALIADARRAGLKTYLLGKRVVLAEKRRHPSWALLSVPLDDGPKAAA